MIKNGNYQDILRKITQKNSVKVKQLFCEIDDVFLLNNHVKIIIDDLPEKLLPRPGDKKDLTKERLFNENREFIARENILQSFKAYNIIDKYQRYGEGKITIWINKVEWKKLRDVIKRDSRGSRIVFQSDIEWQDIKMKFIDGHNVTIKIKDKRYKLNYAELEFADRRTHNPSQLWEFLRTMSQVSGDISWKDTASSDKFKKMKQRLSTHLRDIFEIDTSPFFPYKESQSYKLKFEILPE